MASAVVAESCDGKLPACSACVKAKVECVGFDAVSKKNVSRSYLFELEQEILTLRREIAARDEAALNGGGSGPSNYNQNRRVSSSSSSSDDQMVGQKPMNGGYIPVKMEAGSALPPPIPPSVDHPFHQHPFQTYSNSGFTQGGSGSSQGGEVGEGRMSELMNGVGFLANSAGDQGSRFIGTSSGISLARMVLSGVMKTGPAGATHPNYTPPGGSGSSATSSPHLMEESSSAEALLALANAAHHPEFIRTSSGHSTSTAQMMDNRRDSMKPMDMMLSADPNQSVNNAPAQPISPSVPQAAPPPEKKKFTIPTLPPRSAIEKLLIVYNEFIQIQNPVLHMPSFLGRLGRVLDDREGDRATEQDLFFVLMFLALSTMSLSRTMDPTSDLRMSSEAFHAEAMKHLDCILASQNYVGLQGVLLCCQYALFNPDRGSIWFLTGMAMRQCVELGYHHETPASLATANALEIDMRRRLFWTVYKMDRQLCFNLGRPPQIPDEFINVAFPSDLDDSCITEQGLLPGEVSPRKLTLRHVVIIRQIQSEIQRRLHRVNPGQDEDTPSQEWFDRMLDRLKTWLAETPASQSTFTSAEMWAVMFHNSVLLLFRPSPACPRPTREALSACLLSSSYLIRIIRRMYQGNKMNYLWLGAHTLFMAGITYLYSLWNVALGNIDDPPSLEESILDIQSCSSVLQALSFNVSSSGACRETFELLSNAVLKRLTEQSRPPSPSTSNTRGTASNDAFLTQSFGADGTTSYGTPIEPALPQDLQGLDDLFLNPMTSHMGICTPSSDPFGTQMMDSVKNGGLGGIEAMDSALGWDSLINQSPSASGLDHIDFTSIG